MADNPIKDFNVKREVQKRAAKQIKGMNESSKETFVKVVDNVMGEMREGNLVLELTDYFRKIIDDGKSPSLTKINTDINILLKKSKNWSLRNPNATPSSINEFSNQITASARSFCRIFDRAASCWAKTS